MKWFDNIYVINLDKRPDRLKQVKKEFKQLGYSFERVSAVDGESTTINWKPNNSIPGWNKNAAALLETTIIIVEDAKAKGYKSILICEDDVQFTKKGKKIIDNYDMPDDDLWDMFFFGVMNEWSPKYLSSDTVILTRAYCCHCYAIHERAYDDYLKLLKERAKPIDWVTADHFMMHGRCLATRYPFAFQKPDYSNIRNKEVHNKVN